MELDRSRAEGALLICPAVYAELLAYPGATERFVQGFLSAMRVDVDYRLEAGVWDTAGLRYARHAERRRKVRGDNPRRLLTDFLIGAHAFLQADRLLTLDAAFYRRNFPELKLL